MTVKTLLITGANGNLGLEVTRFFAEKSNNILATWFGQKPSLVHPMVEWIEWGAGNLVMTQVLASKIEEVGSIQGWIHLAGGFWGGFSFEMTTPVQLSQMMKMNFESAVELAPVVIPVLAGESHGTAIFMGGEAGLKPSPGYGAYGVSKAALIYFAETLAQEVKGQGKTVNVVIPSTIDTAANRKSMPDADFSRWIQSGELIGVYEFLLSPQGSSINGSIIRLNK